MRTLAAALATLFLLAAAPPAWSAGNAPANLRDMKALAEREAARGDAGAAAYAKILAGSKEGGEAGGQWLVGAAQRGIPEAQHHLGMILEASGEPREMPAAAGWHLKAAEGGYVPAQAHVAQLFLEGRGVPKDAGKAIDWATKAALAGDMDAQAWLGARYYDGKVVAKDPVTAVAWLEKAARQGHRIAAVMLIGIYRQESPAKDLAKAEEWSRRLAGGAKR